MIGLGFVPRVESSEVCVYAPNQEFFTYQYIEVKKHVHLGKHTVNELTNVLLKNLPLIGFDPCW